MKTVIMEDTGEIVAKGVDVPRNPPFMRTQYNYDTDKASEDSGVEFLDLSRTQQQYKDEVDINTIIERFGITGELPENLRVPQSGDFTEVMTYQDALNVIRRSDEAFAQMPANIRAEFDNNPQKFLDFANDPKNKEKAKELGLLVPEKAPEEPRTVRIDKTSLDALRAERAPAAAAVQKGDGVT